MSLLTNDYIPGDLGIRREQDKYSLPISKICIYIVLNL